MPLWGWAAFIAAVLALLAADQLLLQRRARRPGVREALLYSAFWALLALAFAGGLWMRQGPAAAGQFCAGWLLELSLSVDNLFVFLLIFAAFRVPERLLYKALFWGILGAVVLRLSFVALGAALISRFSWTLSVFGALLLVTGLRMLLQRDHRPPKVGDSLVVKALRRWVPMTKDYGAEGSFFVWRKGLWMATPLLAVVLVVESSDVLFAVDSIPAVFGVTKDPFIVFTSNIFAVLGLRSLFFALQGLLPLFRFLKTGLSAILVLIGLKMLLSRLLEESLGWVHLDAMVMVLVALFLGGSVALSLVFPAPVKKPRATAGFGNKAGPKRT